MTRLDDRTIVLIKLCANLIGEESNHHTNNTTNHCAFVVIMVSHTNKIDHGKKGERNGKFIDNCFHGTIIHLLEHLSSINIVV